MAIYVNWEGIKGNVTAKGFKDHILVNSFSFGVSRSISMEAGEMRNRESTRPKISEVVITKLADDSATAIFKESLSGSSGKKITLNFVKTGSDEVTEFMTYDLEDALVTGYTVDAGIDGQPMEKITLSYSKIISKYIDSDKTNKSGSPHRVGYDLSRSVAM